MNTRIITIEEQNIDEKLLEEAGQLLRAGGLVAFPTETVYGLGGDAFNRESSRKIYAAKGRPSDNPLIVHISRWEDIYRVASVVSPQAKALADRFWPGPLTMILPKAQEVPYETTGGLDTVAVRLPSHPIAQKLIAAAGGFVAAPSANTSGKPSPTQARFVVEDMNGRIDMIIDGGEVGIGLESTIIDLTLDPPQILRPGFITQRMLTETLGCVENDVTLFCADSKAAPRAPGMKYRHYAPKGELTIVEGAEDAVVSYINEEAERAAEKGEKVGIIGTQELLHRYRAQVIKSVGSRRDELSIGKHLYTILREFDDEQVTRIYSESFQSDGYGQAIMNRLLKAAGHRVVHLSEGTAGEQEKAR